MRSAGPDRPALRRGLATRRDVLCGATGALTGIFSESCMTLPPPSVAHETLAGGLEVRGTRLYKGGKPFFVSGINYWAATTLARDGDSAGWDRVRRDLDVLQSLGINVVRTMGGTEGPDTEPLRIVPSIQPREGRYEESGVHGVQRFAEEIRLRGLFAIVVLNNFWPWSGGMAQYLAWAGQGPIPYPPPIAGGTWSGYEAFAGRFYRIDGARKAFRSYVRFLVPRLKDNPAVIWELANEPRGTNDVGSYRRWVDETARLIKSLAPGQLVTTGSEGQTASPESAGLDVIEDHRSPAVDFATFHLWAQNWGWVHPDTLAADFPGALALARRYVEDHAARAVRLGKPILLEEFGFPRDGASFDPDGPTRLRDRYFEEIYSLVSSLLRETPIAGIMPWAWAGDARPPRPGEFWRPGDPLSGDPPHEPQGWYGVYARDSTVAVIRQGSARIASFART